MPSVAETFLFSRFARIATVGLLIIAAFSAWRGAFTAAVTAVVCAGMIWARYRAEIATGNSSLIIAARLLNLLFLVALAPAILTHAPGLAQWSYIFPLSAFALWPLPWAGILILPYLALVIAAGLDASLGPDRHQFVACALLAVLLSGIFVFLREYKTRQLAPLRRTDELTQAASRDYLSADLHKEIQRSEREGIEMAVLLIGLDIHRGDALPEDDIHAILPASAAICIPSYGISTATTGLPISSSWPSCRAPIPPKPHARRKWSAKGCVTCLSPMKWI